MSSSGSISTTDITNISSLQGLNADKIDNFNRQNVNADICLAKKPYIDNAKIYRCSPGNKSLNAELYGIGTRLRHLQPPGGNESGVFDMDKEPLKQFPIRKNAKGNLKSRIFEDPTISPPREATPLKKTTHYRIFQKTPPPNTRSFHNKFKSTVFDPDPPIQVNKEEKCDDKRMPNKFKSTVFDPDPPMKPVQVLKNKKDPITGINCKITDREVNCKKLSVRNPITFEGVSERDRNVRFIKPIIPPGGSSRLVLEYDETPQSF